MRINVTVTAAAKAAVICVCVFMAAVPARSAESAAEHRARGDAFYDKREYLKAVESYTKAIGLEPSAKGRAVYYRYIGSCYKGAGQTDKAIEAYTKAIELDPKDYQYYRNRGDVHRERGDGAAAIRDYTKAIELSRDGYNYKCRGDVYMASGDYAAAVKDYEEALRASPNQESYKKSLAEAKKKRGYAVITLTSPRVTSRGGYVVSACVKSELEVEKVFVTVNGSAQRGIGVVDDDGCEHAVSQKVALREGENVIRIEAVSGGVTNGESFTVTYNAPAEPVGPVDEPVGPAAVDGRRAALVIGNAGYKNSPLRNAVSDAKSVAAKLKALDFEVSVATDLGGKAMVRAIEEFAAKAKGAAVVLFYYSGHGVQYNNVNYFLPVDIGNISSLSAVQYDAVSMGRLTDAMDETKAEVKIMMLDACRSPPFTKGGGGLASAGTKSRGTFIAYATAAGQVAMDNSTFTKSFLNHVDTPGLRIEDLFKNVAVEVMSATDDTQVPWTESNMVGNFYFRRK